MAADHGTTIPVAGLMVVALFFSTYSILGHPGYDLLRQVENGDVKRSEVGEPKVEARLWEDPLASLARHRSKQATPCSPADSRPVAQTSAVAMKDGGVLVLPRDLADKECRDAIESSSRDFKALLKGEKNTTVIAALLKGGTFNGAEEARRRIRYAVLAGLKAEDYVPDNSERLGLLHVEHCDDWRGCRAIPAASTTTLLYETLTRTDRDGKKIGRAAVVWVDDSILGKRWLSAVANLLGSLRPTEGEVQLRIIGPNQSEQLVAALSHDLPRLKDDLHRADAGNGTDDFLTKVKVLANLRVLSPFATMSPAKVVESVPQKQLVCEEDGQPVDCINEAFNWLIERSRFTQGATTDPLFVRTIGVDDLLIHRLVTELCGRGLYSRIPGTSRRVAVFYEWDSIYARSLARNLETELNDKCREEIEVDSYPYLRGLDGVTMDGVPPQSKRVADREKDKAAGAAPSVEWPESRDQRDYVRRLVVDRLASRNWYSANAGVKAIGIIGSDVHDKLLLAQALRAVFPDRILFTTDMDVRLLHPDVIQYTRNLLVASSLPLAVDESLQKGTPPFRDSYQTATFLAARQAVAADAPINCDGERLVLGACISRQLGKSSMFEIGHKGVAELLDKGLPDEEKRTRRLYAALAFLVLGAFAVAMVGVHPAPAMEKVRHGIFGGDFADISRMHVVLAGMQVAAIGYAAGVVMELLVPSSLGSLGVVVLAALATAAYGITWRLAPRGGQAGFRGLWAALAGCAIVGGMTAWGAMAWRWGDEEMHEPFGLAGGLSAWPSILLLALVIVLFAWFLDFTWCKTADAAARIARDYFPAEKAPSADEPTSGFWLWRPGSDSVYSRSLAGPLDAATLWRQYRLRLLDRRRLKRLAAWGGSAVVLMLLVMLVIGGQLPGIPARGMGDRFLFLNVMIVSGISVLILLMLVSDTTVQTWRFIIILKSGRTAYPRKTVEAFAVELGPQVQDQAAEAIAARIADRRPNIKAPARNSLLDDWIDARLLAEQTAAIGPMIVFPFVLLGLVVVSRSRVFDNWDVGNVVLAILGGFLLLSVALAALLNIGAEIARRKSLERMEEDLLWLKGTGPRFDKLAERFPSLIAQVRGLRKGAFAPFFEQPLVQAILVPLGGAGGVQLFEHLLLARSA